MPSAGPPREVVPVDAAGSTWDFTAIGTSWQIQSRHPLAAPVRAEVDDVIAAFDVAWSRFRADSLVSLLAEGAATVIAPPDTSAMFETYRELADATGGAVDPLVGEALARRGYDARYSLVDRGPAAARGDWQHIVRWSPDALTLTEPATIDVGALGKGRLVDLVREVVRRHTSVGVIDASGDIAVWGGVERVALEHPFDPRRAIGVWEVSDVALCASATNRRAWGDGLHHVLDARTGEPVRAYAATWAVASTAMIADAAATALFFDGGDAFAHRHGVEWVRMATDGRVEWSHGCKAELFT